MTQGARWSSLARDQVRGVLAASAHNADEGYATAVLLVALSVMGIMLAVAMPIWKEMAQREKETGFVFRGQQYARAVGLFQRRHGPGTLPPTIDILLEEDDPRKKFNDPITNDEFDGYNLTATTAGK